MAIFIPDTKNTASFSNETKNSASFAMNLRHGIDVKISDIADKTFTDTIYANDTTQIKDLTFEQLQANTWNNQTKN